MHRATTQHLCWCILIYTVLFISSTDHVSQPLVDSSDLDAESPHPTNFSPTPFQRVEKELPALTYESDAPPAVPERGTLDHCPYSKMAEPPSELTQLNESNLQQIASNLPYDKWEPLGRVLGLSNSDLDNIAASHDSVDQRYQMLQLWCSENEDATWEELANALCSEEVGCTHLAKKFQTSGAKPGACACTHLWCFCVCTMCTCTYIRMCCYFPIPVADCIW